MTAPADMDLDATADAFDSIADGYDGPKGNSPLIKRMREIVWCRIEERLDGPSRLVDIGCGPGIDAEHFANLGHHVIASDWSPGMVEHAAARQVVGSGAIAAVRVGAHELDRLDLVPGSIDLAYSDFGPLNCVPDLHRAAIDLAAFVRPGGFAVVCVMGRYCPWEVVHYSLKRRWKRVGVRFARSATPVNLNGHSVSTRYFTPREFVREWNGGDGLWEVASCQGLSTFVPPPYMEDFVDSHPHLFNVLVWLDRRTSHWPLMRSMGDHFLLVLQRTGPGSAPSSERR